jgi:hypothetical protein
LNHINKVKALANQLVCLEVPVKNEVAMILLKSLPSFYEHLITTLKTMLMMELIMKCMAARLM